MPQSSAEVGTVYQTILDGYNRAELRRTVKTCLNEDFDALVSDKAFQEQAFELVQWAERQNRLQDLAECLHKPKTKPAEGEPPYKGLEFYGVADAALFFGRETLTAELATYLKDHRFLAVVGASGSGKSSVVRAGVIPALQRGEIFKGSDKWVVHIVTPTARPLETLALELLLPGEAEGDVARFTASLRESQDTLHLRARRILTATNNPHMLLVVDQFEELFTLCKERTEQKAYVDNLLAAAAPESVTTVIFTLRADFYPRCAEFDNLRLALSQHQNYIGPMAPEELRAAIEKPAVQNGWDFEPGLVDAILDDVAGEAGSLPLLSHALLETWKRRSGRTLTFAGYHAAGGVRGAIAHTADALYAELPPEQQAIARNIFLRLTTLGDGTQDTRRRAPLPELLGSGAQAAQVQAVLKRLEDDRLVTAERAAATTADAADKPETVYVDVTHEALIREWPRLSEWLHEDREGLLVHRRLTEAAQEWEDLQRDAGSLFRGALLAQTVEWATAHGGDLNELEREFLDASQAQLDAERRSRQRVVAGIVIGALLFAAAMAVLAVIANNRGVEADNAKATAQANLSLAQQKLDELKVEELLTSARDKKAQLDAAGAVADFNAATAAAAARGKVLDVSSEISDTLRYVATTYVQEGEKILCEALFDPPERCEVPVTGQAAEPMTTSVVIEQTYLAWARDVAPQIVGWSSYTSTVQQQAVISATALYSQALALNPLPDTPVYVWIAPGAFDMGSTDEQCATAGIGECPTDEQPWHPVELDGYWMQRTEVTNEQYKRCVDAGGCPDEPSSIFWKLSRSARLPVTYVDWNQASAYAAWVGGKLPTEAEWEKACRSADGRAYPWGDEPPATELLNYSNEVGNTTEVGTYPPGANGLYDMAGNVLEWTADWYSEEYYNSSPERNPVGPQEGDTRTLRGGAWNLSGYYVRCARRSYSQPGNRINGMGFRLVSPGL